MAEETLVTLQVPDDYDGDEVSTPPWLWVAKEQLSYDEEHFDSLEDGELMALLFLEDYVSRNWVRRFVLLDVERAIIFDEAGRRIDDVDACSVYTKRGGFVPP